MLELGKPTCSGREYEITTLGKSTCSGRVDGLLELDMWTWFRTRRCLLTCLFVFLSKIISHLHLTLRTYYSQLLEWTNLVVFNLRVNKKKCSHRRFVKLRSNISAFGMLLVWVGLGLINGFRQCTCTHSLTLLWIMRSQVKGHFTFTIPTYAWVWLLKVTWGYYQGMCIACWNAIHTSFNDWWMAPE